MTRSGSAVLLAGMLLLAGCGGKKEQASQAVKPPVAVETATAGLSALVEALEVTGSLEPKFAVDVRTQIPGLVKQVNVTEWVRVAKGQPLARIDAAETEALLKRAEAGVAAARAAVSQAQAAQGRAEREQARIAKLKESGLATQQAVDDSRTESEAAVARIEAARAQVTVSEEEVRQARARLAKAQLLAPLDGVVALRDINVGDLASDAATARPVFRIVDNRLLNLTVTVPSAEAARVKTGQSLEFTVDSLPGRTFTGRVMYINPELNAADRSLKLIAEVRNVPEILKGGLFAKGRIVTGTRKGVLQIPRQALAGWDIATRTGSVPVIEGETARIRPVATGAVSGELVEITRGLKPGERFVLRGGFNLKDGDRVLTRQVATEGKGNP